MGLKHILLKLLASIKSKRKIKRRRWRSILFYRFNDKSILIDSINFFWFTKFESFSCLMNKCQHHLWLYMSSTWRFIFYKFSINWIWDWIHMRRRVPKMVSSKFNVLSIYLLTRWSSTETLFLRHSLNLPPKTNFYGFYLFSFLLFFPSPPSFLSFHWSRVFLNFVSN